MKAPGILLGVLLFAMAGANTTRLNILEEKIRMKCPQAEILDVEFRDEFTEIEFLCNGDKVEAVFDIEGQLLYTEREAKADSKTVKKIMNRLKKSHSGWSVDDFHLIETPDTSFYVVEMLRNGIESNVYFALDGKYYRPFNMTAGEQMTEDLIASAYEMMSPPYDFLEPDKVFDLPELLREVSGIAKAGDGRLYLVQDELGAVFEFDTAKEEVTGMSRFADVGDFEDVATDGQNVYVLRSDGVVFSFEPGNHGILPEQAMIPVQSTDIEGLFYDVSKNRLLLASKNEPVNDSDDLRLVYSLKPDDLYNPEVLLRISMSEINQMLVDNFPQLARLDKTFEFNPSAIAVHPLTGEIYVLSASDRLLAIYHNLQLKSVFPLPAEMYYKPEGLAFTPGGDLYIASEGIKNGWLGGQIFLLRSSG